MNDDARWMRELVREAAREPVPKVDWDKVEQRLLERIDREPIALGPRRSPSYRPLLAIAAAAAGMAAAVGLAAVQVPSATQSESRSPQAAAPLAASPLGASARQTGGLHEGDRLVADSGPLTVQHPGHATWVLADSSAARIERLGAVVVIDLEAGSVKVEVEPRSEAESFVVRVGETAVSVHGTVFEVQRRGDRAFVQVLRGSVAVGPRSRRGQAVGWLMVAPSSASFPASGAGDPDFELDQPLPPAPLPEPFAASRVAQQRRAAVLEAPGADLPDPGAPVPGAQPTPRAPGPAPVAQNPLPPPPEELPSQAEPELPQALTEAEAQGALGALRSRIADCHRRLGPVGGDGLKIVVQSRLTILVASDGHVTSGRFDPPLATELQSCAGSALLSTTFPKARSASTLLLHLRF